MSKVVTRSKLLTVKRNKERDHQQLGEDSFRRPEEDGGERQPQDQDRRPAEEALKRSASAAEHDKLSALDDPLLGLRSAFACVEAGSVHALGRPMVV